MKIRLLTYALICALLAGTTGCPRLHSPGQEELAHDVQARYKTLTPSAVQALEGLDADLDKLIESQRADFEIYKETSESQLVTTTWGKLEDELCGLEKKYRPKQVQDPNAPPDKKKCVDLSARPVQEVQDPNASPDDKEKKRCADLSNRLIQQQVDDSVKDVEDRITCEQKVLTALSKQSDGLAAAVKEMNKGLKEAEKKRSVQEQLDETKRVINVTVTSLKSTLDKLEKDDHSPLTESLSITVAGLSDFLTQINKKPDAKKETERVFSLIVEAMRLGRDIAVLEKEVVDQEASYHENVVGLLKSKRALMPNPDALKKVRMCLEKRYPPDERTQATVARLAYEAGVDEETTTKAIADTYADNRGNELREAAKYQQALENARAAQSDLPAPLPARVTPRSPAVAVDCDGDPQTKVEELRDVLNVLARVQSLRLTNDMRIKELELRIAAEKYRNVKLKEAIFERQRMTLVSFGLVGVVRYAEGGLRSEDIANLINIARAIAEGVIAARI
ncbi:MAG: hypothetical protein JOZ96_09615 [Acidobacteria bacterium]|nr:hypothetical protein [Acidobacteriota bacterium]